MRARRSMPGSWRARLFLVALFAADRPELVALIEADHLGRLRTGAASAVAAKHLAHENATSLGVIGCGTQAETAGQVHPCSCSGDREGRRLLPYGAQPAPILQTGRR